MVLLRWSTSFFGNWVKNWMEVTSAGATFRKHEALPETVRVEVVGFPGGEEGT